MTDPIPLLPMSPLRLRLWLPCFVLLLAMLAGVVIGCVTLSPGSDPLVVRAEQATALALDTFDLLLRIEREHEADLLTLNPRIHQFAEHVRREAPQWLATARLLTRTYKANRTDVHRANLTTYLSLLSASIQEAQTYSAQFQ